MLSSVFILKFKLGFKTPLMPDLSWPFDLAEGSLPSARKSVTAGSLVLYSSSKSSLFPFLELLQRVLIVDSLTKSSTELNMFPTLPIFGAAEP